MGIIYFIIYYLGDCVVDEKYLWEETKGRKEKMKDLRFPIMASPYDKDIAKETFNIFSKKEGSMHIASEFALSHLSAILSQMRGAITNVLEIGAGIGTITHLLLTHKYAPKNIKLIEDNDFCLAQLASNIRVEKIYKKLSEISTREKYGLIIIDGLFEERELSKFFHNKTIFFIEGNRRDASISLEKIARDKGMNLEFRNIIQGRKFIHFDRNKNRIKFFKKIKGCRVGQVYI